MTIELDVTPREPVPPSGPATWRRRWLAAGAVAVVAGAAAVAVALGSPPPPPAVVDLDGRLGWVEKLVDAPPRGALAEDAAFTRELTDTVTDLVRTGSYHRDLAAVDEGRHPSQEVKLIYADDIDDRRIVLLALRPPVAEWTSAPSYPDPLAMRGRTKIVWLSGPRGSSPTWLATYSVENGGSVDGSFWLEVFQLDADPTAPGQMLAIPLPVVETSGRVVASRIVATPPHTATAVRFVDPDTGAGSDSRVVNGAAFVLTASLAPLSRLTSAEVVAVNAAGNPVAANVPAAPFVSNFIANWE